MDGVFRCLKMSIENVVKIKDISKEAQVSFEYWIRHFINYFRDISMSFFAVKSWHEQFVVEKVERVPTMKYSINAEVPP